MFPRGSRFPAEKPSDVPGPGHYNIQDPEDKYKRGAFLEGTDRFDKDKPSDVPGPGAYGKDDKAAKPMKKAASTSINDRYAALQKKLEDLERVHLDGKKAHQTEQERLKREISQEKRAGAEHAEQLAKAKKQLDAQDARIQELKKAQATGDVELREVRVKLRSAEQERTQLAAKQADAGDARKAAAALDAKRKEELKERDRRIAELERALAAEQRRREDAETRAADARRTADAATHGAKGAQADLQSRLDAAVADATEARAALEGADEAREELVDRVNAFSDMLARAAEQYGRLATVTVSAAMHARLKAEHAALELREFKLARKLANTEDQVQELAHLIRQTKDQNALLAAQLRDADGFASSSSSALRAYLRDSHDADTATELAALAAEVDILQARADAREAGLLCEAAASSQWQHHAQDLLGAYTDAELALQQHSRELAARGKALAEAVAGREKLSAEVAQAQVERDEAKGQLAAATSAADRARAAELAAQHEVEATVRARKTDAAAHGDALQKEKDATRRAANAAQKNKLAEEALQTEVEQLTAELMDAMQYQDAYRELTEQVSITIARSNLAEEEVEKLSRFNAEILGHRNASQKIMYVERIRRELAETKQQLLLATRDHDAALTDNQDLRWELDMYKSVSDGRPRTGFTRVTRVPLGTQSLNGATSTAAMAKSTAAKGGLSVVEESDHRPGDMTLDDLLPPQ